MSDIIILTIGAMVCMAIIAYSSYMIIAIQQRTIDSLTSKLMAKDYKEYRVLEPKVAEIERPRRKPLSWHDDVDLDPDEVEMSR